MSHWAEIDETNTVIRIVVGDNNDPNGDEGYQWIIENLGGNWIQTSYNGNIRKQYAGIGYSYNETLDMFILPKCHDEAVLNKLGDWDCENIDHEVVLPNG